MRSFIAVTLIATCLLSSLAAEASGEAPIVPVPAGWSAPDQEYRYDPDQLWEYINGAAELFLGYGVELLAVRDLERDETFATVSVYDMGRPMNAFGIFEREGPTDRPRLDAPGAGAFLQPPYQGLMYKDRFYVKVDSGGGLDEKGLRELLAAVAAGLPGSNEPPADLALLPGTDREPGTVAFTGRDFLGFADLRNCLHADYVDAETGQGYQVFAMKAGGDPFATLSRQWQVQEIDGDVLAWREVPYQGVVAMRRTAAGALGVAGEPDLEAAGRRLRAVAAEGN